MITKDEAFSIIRKEKPNHKITTSYEFPDKFAFVCIPKGADPDTFICAATYVMKKDGSISYGMPTVQDMEHAVAIKDDTELKHHGVKGQSWGKRNGPPYPLDAQGKADLRKQRMESYGKSITKGAESESGSSEKKSVFKKISEKKAQKEKQEAENKAKEEQLKREQNEEAIRNYKSEAIRKGDVNAVQANRDIFSDEEVRSTINRYKLNKELSAITVKNVKTGAEKVDSLISGLQRGTRLAGAGIDAWNNVAKIGRGLGYDWPMFDGNVRRAPERNIANNKSLSQLESIITNPERYTAKDIANAKNAYQNLSQAQNQVRSERLKNLTVEQAFQHPEYYTKKELDNAIARSNSLDNIWKATARKQEEAESYANMKAEVFNKAGEDKKWFSDEVKEWWDDDKLKL